MDHISADKAEINNLSAHSLISHIAQMLAIPDETLALAYAYIARFQKAAAQIPSKDPVPHLDDHTIALACLHLSDKITYATTQLVHLLVTAWHLMHPDDPFLCPPWLPKDSSSPLTNGSIFLSLRNAIDAAEMVVLRALAFELPFPTPVLHDEECLDRGLAIARRERKLSCEDHVSKEQYQQHSKPSNKRKCSPDAADEDLSRKKRREEEISTMKERKLEMLHMPDSTEVADMRWESNMVGVMETSIRRQVRQLSLEACKNTRLISKSAPIVAAAAVYVALSDRHLTPPFAWSDWTQYHRLLSWSSNVASLTLHYRTFDEFVEAVHCVRELNAAATMLTLAKRERVTVDSTV